MDLSATTTRRENNATRKLRGQPRGKLSQQERDRRRNEGLCFTCGKPGHMARDCKGKQYPSKQVNATTARAVCATDRRELDEDELERLGIHRQLGLTESDVEYLDEALERRSSGPEEENPEGDKDKTTSYPPSTSDESESSEDSESSSPPMRWVRPQEKEVWQCVRQTDQTNYYTKVNPGYTYRTCRFEGPREYHQGDEPELWKIYNVTYTDPMRVVFRTVGYMTLGQPEIVVEQLTHAEEIKDFSDVLEVEDIWEVVTTGRSPGTGSLCRIWARTITEQWQKSERALEMAEVHLCTFPVHVPHRLMSWTPTRRVWLNLYNKEIIIEGLGPERPRPQVIAATEGSGKFEILATLRGKKITIMLDTGATGNFISPRTVARINAPIRNIQPYVLTVVDGTEIAGNDGIITQEIVPSELKMKDGHTESVQFDIAPIGKFEAILGMPWIAQHNPDINWKKKTMSFSRCHCEGSQ
jgi:hypothetical protein